MQRRWPRTRLATPPRNSTPATNTPRPSVTPPERQGIQKTHHGCRRSTRCAGSPAAHPPPPPQTPPGPPLPPPNARESKKPTTAVAGAPVVLVPSSTNPTLNKASSYESFKDFTINSSLGTVDFSRLFLSDPYVDI